MPRLVDKEARRRELIEVAARVFSDRGFRNARIEDIAREAGVAKGLVYDYFSSKEELFFAVFEWYNERISLWIRERLKTAGTARRRLTLLARLFVQAGLDHIDMYSLTLEFWAAAGIGVYEGRFLASFRDAYRTMRAMVSETIRAGQSKGEFRDTVDPEAVAAVLVGAFDAAVLQHWLDREFEPLREVDRFLDAFMIGMSAPDVDNGDSHE
jgi:TetR/AcrR family fatty acid metabolism transcriptional regulator